MVPIHRIQSLPQAIAALTAAAARGEEALLLSAPQAVRSLGAGGFLALIQAARAEVPQAHCLAVLDCGSAPGLAMAAMRLGLAVRVEAPLQTLDKLRQMGGRVFADDELLLEERG